MGSQGHAEFLMADASYRVNAEGKMYCHADIDIDKKIMGLPVKASDTYEITIGKSWLSSDGESKSVEVFFSGNGTGNEFIFEASDGAHFSDGGCNGRRSLLSGGAMVVPANTQKVSLKAAWGKCGEPPFPCQIYMTQRNWIFQIRAASWQLCEQLV